MIYLSETSKVIEDETTSCVADRTPLLPANIAVETPIQGAAYREVDRLADPLAGIQVRRATHRTDLEKVYAVRYRGYAKYFGDPMQVREALDQTPGCLLLLATDARGHALGTLRLLDRRYGPIELDNYLDMDQLLPSKRHAIVEATRYSVPACPASKWIKLALCKAYFRYCRDTLAHTMLIWIRPSAEREYQRMLFEKVIGAGAFSHPRLGNLPHQTWLLDVQSAPARYREYASSLYTLFEEEEHPHIRYD